MDEIGTPATFRSIGMRFVNATQCVLSWLTARPAWLRDNGSWFGSLAQWVSAGATALAAYLILSGYQAASEILENVKLKQNLEAETKRLNASIEDQKKENGNIIRQNQSLASTNAGLATEKERLTKSIKDLEEERLALKKSGEEQQRSQRQAQLGLACAAAQSATIDMLNMSVNNRNLMALYARPASFPAPLDVMNAQLTLARGWDSSANWRPPTNPIFHVGSNRYFGSMVRLTAPSTQEVRVGTAVFVFSQAAVNFLDHPSDRNVLLSALQRVGSSYPQDTMNRVMQPTFNHDARPTIEELIAATESANVATEYAYRLQRACFETSLDYSLAPSGVVFFDSGKLELSSQALVTMMTVASSFKDSKITRMTVWGHTDTDEDADLSTGRAIAVRDALVREGVPAEVIAAFGQGPFLQNVRTGFNVREPQNRRAEIMFW